jgi:hypothetical protein
MFIAPTSIHHITSVTSGMIDLQIGRALIGDEVSTESGSDRVIIRDPDLLVDFVISETRSLPLSVLTPWPPTEIRALPAEQEWRLAELLVPLYWERGRPRPQSALPTSRRLCRLMCGTPLAFRPGAIGTLGYAQLRAQPRINYESQTEAQSASAHRAA